MGGGVGYPHIVGPGGGVGGQVADQGADEAGGLAQAFVVPALLGQVGELVGQVGAGVAQPAGFAGVAEHGLHQGQGDQVGVGQAGLDADLGAPGSQVRAFFEEGVGVGVQC